MKTDICLVRQRTANGFADHSLIIYQKNHDVVLWRVSE